MVENTGTITITFVGAVEVKSEMGEWREELNFPPKDAD